MNNSKTLIKTNLRLTIATLIALFLYMLTAGCNTDNNPDNDPILTHTPEPTQKAELINPTNTTNKTSKQQLTIPPPITTPEASPTKISNELTRAEVVEVLEGNLIKVLTNGNVLSTIQYIGVDIPTKPIDINTAAKEMNKFLVQGKIVLLEQDQALPDDESEIKLRHVFVDGEYVNVKLLSTGLARMSEVNPYTHKEKLTRASKEAQNLNVGMWRTIAGQENDEKAGTSSYPKLGCGTLPCQPKK